VVQRGLPVHVWGMASPGEAITAGFRGESRSATADALGRWSLYFSPGEAGGPFPLTIQGSNKIALSDILVGDVWVASGQSNMEFPMTELTNAQSEIAAAQYPQIRLFRVEHNPADYPVENVTAKAWTACTPETAAESSAVAYFFARDLQKKIGVPIGLMETFWGGTPAESWTSLPALSADAALMPVFAARAQMVTSQSTTALQLEKAEHDYAQSLAASKAQGTPPPAWLPWHPDFRAWAPAALYNGMIAPLTPFAIRGVIWYQGEANTDPLRAPLYSRLLPTMIRDWRNAWGEGDFPFLLVQIANWNSDPQDDWPEVRDAQRRTLALRNTAMAVSIDIGDPVDIHPKNKQDVGARLALGARAIAYGEKIEYSGPLFRQLTREGHSLRVWFDHAGGLTARGGVPKGFEIASADRKFVPAAATIENAGVVVSSPNVPDPVYVRYGWAPNPDCNLYNAAGLPASPFQAGRPQPQ
ncbi:MAG TPA: sialate O-acetylesterase, partial [Terriglobales bacterium]